MPVLLLTIMTVNCSSSNDILPPYLLPISSRARSSSLFRLIKDLAPLFSQNNGEANINSNTCHPKVAQISEEEPLGSSLPREQVNSEKNLNRDDINNKGGRVASVVRSICLGEVSHSLGHIHKKREIGKSQRNVNNSFQIEHNESAVSTIEGLEKEGKQCSVQKIWERVKAYSAAVSRTFPVEDKESCFSRAEENKKEVARVDLSKSSNEKKTPILSDKSDGAKLKDGRVSFEFVRGEERSNESKGSGNCSSTTCADLEGMNHKDERISQHQKTVKADGENLLLDSPEMLGGVDDLIRLKYLNEPSVICNLQSRYHHDIIYTKAGPILIAINPYKDVSLHGSDVLTYSPKAKDTSDVYNIADSVFRVLKEDGVNQSIIISGESGAGKTETAKKAMQYLASFGGGRGVGDEILQTNLILEAFGNAKTLSNNNSSRFGKLTDMYFDDSGRLQGAKIHAYLLEKSRVVQRAKDERSYHIFYQLCAGASASLRERLKLRQPEEYHFLNQSNCLTIDDFDDAKRFKATMRALNLVQISQEDQEKVFAMLAAVLWLGNITFSSVDNENYVAVDQNEAIRNAANLLGCDVGKLTTAFSMRKILVGNENILQMLTLSQAVGRRNALAEAIYSSLFDWLVDSINKSLGTCWKGRTISILDIYGFESFDSNRFEQFCINYANERLHQYFNHHLFKFVEEEYISEGINWTKIEYEDNQKCLDLIEKKPLGLISLLDESSALPKETDLTLASKLKKHLQGHSCFRSQNESAFSLHHYAGEVMYDTTGFLEKNRDLLSCDLVQLLSSCNSHLPQLCKSANSQGTQKFTSYMMRENGKELQKKTIIAKFKAQLFKLMERLENTSPHFIWCIKPNRCQVPGVFDHKLVLQQLHSCGILEVVRISRYGYPIRITHEHFRKSYGIFLSRNTEVGDIPNVCRAIIHKFDISPQMYHVGSTKIFFRAGQIEKLEDIRTQTISGVVKVQKYFRGNKVRTYFKKLKRLATFLQSLVRCKIQRNQYKVLRERHHAAITIQRKVRCRIARQKYIRIRMKVILIQAVTRGWLARTNSIKQYQMQVQTSSSITHVEESIASPQVDNANNGDMRAKLLSEDDMEFPTTISLQTSFLGELQQRLHRAEAAVRETQTANVLLHQKLEQYESKMMSMEKRWKKQDVDGCVLLHEDCMDWTDSDTERGSTLDLSSSPQKLCLHSDRALARELSAERSLVGRLVKAFELTAQGRKDCSIDSVQVKVTKTRTNLNPEKELKILIHGFYLWKSGFKLRLYEMENFFENFGSSVETS